MVPINHNFLFLGIQEADCFFPFLKGLLILAEVAFGNMYKLTQAQYMDKYVTTNFNVFVRILIEGK